MSLVLLLARLDACMEADWLRESFLSSHQVTLKIASHVTKQLIVYSRYLMGGDVCTSFVNMLELPAGTARSITDAVCKLCGDLNLDMSNRFCGLGSDGASVMLGNRGGVSKLLKDEVPFLVAHHCIAHRLALACGQSPNEIPYVKRFKNVLDQLYRFYDNSAVCTAGLRSIQEVLDDPQLKLAQAKDVRWLNFTRESS